MPTGHSEIALEAFRIEHGPRNFLGQVLRKAYRLSLSRGVRLRLGSMEQLALANDHNKASWKAVFMTFDHRCSQLSPKNAYCILGENADGDVVVTAAARLFDWQDTNLAAELVSMRMLYADPASAQARGEVWNVESSVARRISGRVQFTGGVWVHPDYRGQKLREIVPRFMRAYGLAQWGPDIICTLQERRLVERDADASRLLHSRFQNMQPGITGRATPFGDLELAVGWMSPLEFMSDLDRFISDEVEVA